jgi:hypothetical protein
MKFQSILKIEGTESYQVLTYFFGSVQIKASIIQDMRALFTAPNYKVIELYDDDWPICVILVESFFPELDQAESAIIGVSLLANAIDGITGSICMFDGIFSGYDEVFLPLCSEQIYSVWVRGGELNLAMDAALRASNEWKEVIANLRNRLSCVSPFT